MAIIFGASVLTSAPRPRVAPAEPGRFSKTRFSSAATAGNDATVVNFVRPGLVVKITAAAIATDGTISTTFTVQDPQTLALDRLGISTPGVVALSFIAATIPAGQTQYTAYTTRVQTSPITKVSATQAGTDAGGTYTANADGSYTYTFKTKATTGFDTKATHAIGIYASRDLTSFGMDIYYSNDVFNFIPAGGKVTVVRDVVPTAACNQCHDPLSAHGGARQLVQLCVLCHQPQTVDPDTGNTVDFKVMIHKIHSGASLPSVVAGGKYQIIGFNQAVTDFSNVVFPSDVRNCTMCHAAPATQANQYLTAVTRSACGSCHDNVNFATGANHAGGLPEADDSQCTQCHIPQGQVEFDASVMGAHTVPLNSTQLPGVVVTMQKVTGGTAGTAPTLSFNVKDKKGNPVDISKMTRFTLVLAGPTTDYSFNVSEDARKASGSGGNYSYTFTAGVPSTATGTFSIGAEGYNAVNINPGTVKQVAVRDAPVNQTINFSVDGKPVVARRQVVDIAKCNVCHNTLSVHGNNRNQVNQCVLCHAPNATDADVRPVAAAPNQGINLALMVHKIHNGTGLTTDFTIYGFGGSKNNFNDVEFPGDLRDCAKCHVNGSEVPPLKAVAAVTDPRGPINPVQPTASACTGCHDDLSTASHALSNTSVLGESCAVCHGANAEFAVPKVHAQ
ncbi:MAG TPA: OmcA/MtrC family decaheme c-type cytochrome [Bryobacteraceae bacterium]